MQRSELKKYYDDSSFAEEMRERREKLSLEVHKLQQELEEQGISLPRVPLEEQPIYRTKLEQRRTELEEMKQVLRDLDHTLDRMDDVSPGQIKEQLILQITQEVPESAESYRKIASTLEQLYATKKAIMQLQRELSPFFEALRDGARARQKRGFFAFIFGHNPKMILARAIQRGVVEAERLVGKVEEEQARELVECFVIEAKKPWNHALYQTLFFQFFDEMAGLFTEYNARLAALDEEIQQALSSLEAWIEAHS